MLVSNYTVFGLCISVCRLKLQQLLYFDQFLNQREVAATFTSHLPFVGTLRAKRK